MQLVFIEQLLWAKDCAGCWECNRDQRQTWFQGSMRISFTEEQNSEPENHPQCRLIQWDKNRGAQGGDFTEMLWAAGSSYRSPTSSEGASGNGCSLGGRLSLLVGSGQLSLLTQRESFHFDTRPKRFRRPCLEDAKGLEETAVV